MPRAKKTKVEPGLSALAASVYHELYPGERKPVRFETYPYVTFRVKVREKDGFLTIRTHTDAVKAPMDLLEELVRVSFMMYKNEPVDRERRARLWLDMSRYVDLDESTQGDVYDLDRVFADLDRQYFKGTVDKPELCWTTDKRKNNVLGYYAPQGDRIVINRALDTSHIPRYVLDYVMYHELLHKSVGKRRGRYGNEVYHHRTFYKLERAFDKYEAANKWIEQVWKQRADKKSIYWSGAERPIARDGQQSVLEEG